MAERAMQRVAPRHLSDHLLAQGRPIVSLAEVADLTGLSPKAAADALVRLRRGHQMFSPHRGLYAAVPAQYRTWGVLPALDFIDAMMGAMGRQYYVALLSAAELHGAAHQRPQVFQVMVDRGVADREFERVRLRFYTRRHLPEVPTAPRNTATGQARVATPAATLLDLASRPNDAGGLSNVATVVAELVEETNVAANELLAACTAYPVASMRRLGWLLERLQGEAATRTLADALANALADAGQSPHRPAVLLDPAGLRRGLGSRRWGVVENTDVDPDL